MDDIRREIEDVVKKIIGESVAIRLGIFMPENVSSKNMVVVGYVDSVDGAIRRGESPINLGAITPIEENSASSQNHANH